MTITGVYPQSPTDIYVEAGEMVVLCCPLNGEDNDAELIWTSHTSQEIDLTHNMSSAEQKHRELLVHGRSLVILNATVNHQGSYSCSLGNSSSKLWFTLRVCTTQSRKHEQRSYYPTTCYSQEACTLYCPDVNTPSAITPKITSNGIIWYKEGESSPKACYFSSVEEKDHGVYTCTRSYLYYGQIYNMTFTVLLDIQPKETPEKYPVIISPHNSDVFPVYLGSTVVIDCKAVMYSDFDEVFWLSSDSFIETNSSFLVYYNYTKETNANKIKMTASLIFREVSEEDLLQNYTCKLQTVTGHSSFVTIVLSQKPSPAYVPLALVIVGFVVMVLTVVVYVRFKMISMDNTMDIY
ncbi:hypothetical protein PBY51_019150 [Eleginops maclovinus]|uniref:Ig-like domain-containing protein n=2 Tax=Eleginops maclovinus TaxID=56733 RepID=A0AAN7YA25_ELEMC|nr:hypothetical protein PBY51_019150 [Eleginops maclovinus]